MSKLLHILNTIGVTTLLAAVLVISVIVMAGGGLALFMVPIAVLGGLVYLVWIALAVPVFGAPAIAFWQACLVGALLVRSVASGLRSTTAGERDGLEGARNGHHD